MPDELDALLFESGLQSLNREIEKRKATKMPYGHLIKDRQNYTTDQLKKENPK